MSFLCSYMLSFFLQVYLFIEMFRSTSDYVCSAKLVAVFFVVGASMTNPMTTALKVQSSAAYGFHGPVSDFFLSIPNMSNISDNHCMCEPFSDFSLCMEYVSLCQRHALILNETLKKRTSERELP